MVGEWNVYITTGQSPILGEIWFPEIDLDTFEWGR